MLNWIKCNGMKLIKLSMTQLKIIGVVGTLLVTSACTTSSKEMLTHDDRNMMEIWQQQTGGAISNGRSMVLMDARQVLRRPITDSDHELYLQDQMSYTRTAQNEIYSQFKRLPNPDLMMYVFPHLAGSDPVPVPGYSTVFPLYQKVQYAMPGERVEPY